MRGLWDLPGPQAFLRKVIEYSEEYGIVGVSAPITIMESLPNAIGERVHASSSRTTANIDASAFKGRPPANHIALRITQSSETRIIKALDFLDLPKLDRMTIICHGLDKDDWALWQNFIANLHEATDADAPLPRMVVLVPPSIPDHRVTEVVNKRAFLKWRGHLGKLDASLFARERFDEPTDLLSRIGSATSIELAGWNLEMLETLLAMDIETQVNPWDVVAEISERMIGGRKATWGNGLVDEWDGEIRQDSLILVGNGRQDEFNKRVWRAHNAAATPFLDDLCKLIISANQEVLQSMCPWRRDIHANHPDRTRHSAFDFDLADLPHALRNNIPSNQVRSLFDILNRIRHPLAHMRPLSVQDIEEADSIHHEFRDIYGAAQPLDWPDCGQRLILMVGSPASGKTTWLNNNGTSWHIVSSDAIRDKHPHLAKNNAAIFRLVHEETVRHLKRGITVAIDATHIAVNDRAAARAMLPDWMDIEYIVVDRPLEDKKRDGGWRVAPEKGNFLEEMHDRFQAGKEVILRGDDDPRVIVTEIQ